ncbi:MAG: hypothetical protein HQK54_13275 [Oligoflexales bacterium]|nr:hypothetical protein [Oligoflexales bacterium]
MRYFLALSVIFSIAFAGCSKKSKKGEDNSIAPSPSNVETPSATPTASAPSTANATTTEAAPTTPPPPAVPPLPADALFLTVGDMNDVDKAKLKEMTNTEVKTRLLANASFFHVNPVNSNNDIFIKAKNCEKALSVPIDVTKDKIEAKLDLTTVESCFRQIYSKIDTKYVVKKAALRVYTRIAVLGFDKDFTTMVGSDKNYYNLLKNLRTILKEINASGTTLISFVDQQKIGFEYESSIYSSGKKGSELIAIEEISGTMKSSEAKDCTTKRNAKTDPFEVEDSCTSFDKITLVKTDSFGSDVTKTTEVDFNHFVSKGIKYNADKAWYSAGQYDVTINQWNGTVVYASDSTPPSYTLTGDKVTMSGELPADSSTGASLRDGSQSEGAFDKSEKSGFGNFFMRFR